jgi:methyl-accepting chemotaxis protein
LQCPSTRGPTLTQEATVSDINDKIDELANGIDELKTTTEELSDKPLSEKAKDRVQEIHEALEEASAASDKLVNDEE